MSGGSYNYICFTLQEECQGRMYAPEMNELVKDFAEVLHKLEWWQSSDIDEESYRKSVKEFKKKWFQSDRSERLKNYIDSEIEKTRDEMYSLIGIERGKAEGK